MDILAFIEAQEIPAPYLATPYRLAPEQGGEQVYALLCDALRCSGKVGIAHVVIGARPHLAVLMPQGRALMLTTLRWASEDRDTRHARGATAARALHHTAGEDAIADGALHPAFQPGLPALTEHVMKDKKLGGFAADDPDAFPDDDELVDERYLMPSLRRSQHQRDGHAMRRAWTHRVRKPSRGVRGR